MFTRRLVAARAKHTLLCVSTQQRHAITSSSVDPTAPFGSNPSGPTSESSFADTVSRQPLLTAAVGAATALAGYTVFCYTKEDNLGAQDGRTDEARRIPENMRGHSKNSFDKSQAVDTQQKKKPAENTREDAKAASHNEFREGKAEAERARRAAQEKRQDAVDAAKRESQDRRGSKGNDAGLSTGRSRDAHDKKGDESDGSHISDKVADAKRGFGRTFGGGGDQTRYEEGFEDRGAQGGARDTDRPKGIY
jgi:hypothetical protein